MLMTYAQKKRMAVTMHEGAERNHCDCSQLSPLLPVLQINAIWEKIKIYNADIYFHKKIVF